MDAEIKLSDVQIRTQLEPGDIGYIIYMHGRLYKQECNYGIAFETYVAAGIVQFYEQFDPARNRAWICEHNDKIIGFMALMDRGQAAQLRYFIIEPEYRSIGLGNKLMNLYIEFLESCGYKYTFLLTTDELPASAHLYQKFGFRLTEEKPSESFGKAVMEQRYERRM